MDNENSIAFHLGQAFKLSVKGMKNIAKSRTLLIQSTAAVLYHALFIILAFALMRSDSETLFILGFTIFPIYILTYFIVNIKKYIPWQVFWIFTAGASVEFILNAAHVIPRDVSIVLAGFDQSLWCAFIVIQVIILFLFALIPYVLYRKKTVSE